jgi:hypothetical protein
MAVCFSDDLALAADIARDTVRAAAAAVGEEERFSREDVVLPTSAWSRSWRLGGRSALLSSVVAVWDKALTGDRDRDGSR